jgi:hypothetical protein
VDVVEFTDHAVVIGGTAVEVERPNAFEELVAILGPPMASRPGSAHPTGCGTIFFSEGFIVTYEESPRRLLSFFVCFEGRDGNPFGDVIEEAAVFPGRVIVAGYTLQGGDDESKIWRIQGLQGIASAPDFTRGNLYVGLLLRRSRGRFGKRTGPKRLVQVVAEWGGVKPFPPRQKRG